MSHMMQHGLGDCPPECYEASTSPRVTITAQSQPVPALVLTSDDARKLGALLLAEAAAYDRHHEGAPT